MPSLDLRRRSLLKGAAATLSASALPLVGAFASEAPSYGGTMVVALGANPQTLNPGISAGVYVYLPA
jgi:ABC-type oligopeptide transport system substrate-binding subunit